MLPILRIVVVLMVVRRKLPWDRYFHIDGFLNVLCDIVTERITYPLFNRRNIQEHE